MSDASALSPALLKWPNVPACYEWLSLDRRGDWRLQGERVTHRGLIEFMHRQYGSDDSGHWFVQNGPQRVYVDLAYTPWVFHWQGAALHRQDGQAAGDVLAVYLDDAGNLLLQTASGIGLLDDRDLPRLLADCRSADATPVEDALLALMAGANARVTWHGHALQAIATVDVPARFNFIPHPRPPRPPSP